MKVSLVGCGCGAETLTAEAAEAIARAEIVIGSERMIREHGKGKPCVSATRPEEIVSALRQSECESAAVLLGGDSGFYSGAKSLSADEFVIDNGVLKRYNGGVSVVIFENPYPS